jgi:hypothetical protein
MLSLGTIGAKAAGNIARLVGQFGSSGPTSGTWNAGDVAPDSRGSFWVCTTSGTPGTWVRIGRSTVFDVRDYGALCDGTTDDTTAVAAAIAAAQAVSTPLIKFQNGSGTFQGGSSTTGAGIVWIPALTLVSNVVGGHRVHITGPGWGAGFYQKASSTGAVYSNRRDTVHAKYTGLQNLSIIGNKANQSSSTNHGVYLLGDLSSDFTNQADEDYDECHHVTNVYIWGTKGDALRMDGSGGNQIMGVKIRNADKNGLWSFQDNNISNVDIGWSGERGVYITGDDCRLSTIKSWYSGQGSASLGQGFLITSDSGTMVGCSAQDNTAEGLALGDSDQIFGWDVKGFMSDSNSKGSAGTYAQIKVNGENNELSATVRNRYNAGGPGTVALNVVSGSKQNKISINPGTGVWGVTSLTSGSSVLSTNEVTFGANASGWEEVAYSATTTLNPLLGRKKRLAARTGALVLANPSWKYDGAELIVRHKENGSGGHAVTYGSDFDTTGTSVSTSANAVTVERWIYSGTSSKWELW